LSEGNKPVNDPSDIAGKNAILENEQLKIELTSVKAERDALKKALAKAQDTIEAQERARMIPILKANTTMTDAAISAMDTESMFSFTENFRVLKRPIAGVKPGADEGEEFGGKLTVPNKFKFGPKGGNK